ncbi:helix-turn-helix domain-containing protein (plasmid) [Streptomyces sp. CA-294286]|uniref:helix-turn-helix domain-containing protein n=1 Tax=Streptomyces sp. CA-294286 TaxID=3240070 RepID=UPI003D92A555
MRYPPGTCRVVGSRAADAGELGRAPLDRTGAGRSRTYHVGVRERLEQHRHRRATRCRRDTVRRWRTRFLAQRLDGLADEPRIGVPRTLTDAQVEEVVVRTLERSPPGGTHWSKRELVSSTRSTVRPIRPWRPTSSATTSPPTKRPGAHVTARAPALPPPLQPCLLLLDQPGRAVVRRAGTTRPRTRDVLLTRLTRRPQDRT